MGCSSPRLPIRGQRASNDPSSGCDHGRMDTMCLVGTFDLLVPQRGFNALPTHYEDLASLWDTASPES
jgi:hypothetical protein